MYCLVPYSFLFLANYGMNYYVNPLCMQVEDLIKKDDHEFMWDGDLRYSLTCPSSLCTELRAGAHLTLLLPKDIMRDHIWQCMPQ